MVEYKIWDTETGEETTGTAERIMMLTDNEKDGHAIWIGTADTRGDMVDTMVDAAIAKDGQPFRLFIAKMTTTVNDHRFKRRMLPAMLNDLKALMDSIHESNDDADGTGIDPDFADIMRQAGFGEFGKDKGNG